MPRIHELKKSKIFCCWAFPKGQAFTLAFFVKNKKELKQLLNP